MRGHGRTALGILLSLLAAEARGQGGNAGSIMGYVYDQGGNPLPGVKIVARSPTQIGGARTAYSNAEGFFRIPALSPGEFDLTASAPKLRSYHSQGVNVGITGATELNMVMEVDTNIDVLIIHYDKPMVKTDTATVTNVYKKDVVEVLPMPSRDQVHTQLINQVPGGMNGRIRGRTPGPT